MTKQCNPHSDANATNNENIINWEGNMVKKKDRRQILMSNIPEDISLSASINISSVESRVVDTIFEKSDATIEEI